MTSLEFFAELTKSLRELGIAKSDEEPIYSVIPGGVSSDIWRVDLHYGPVCVKRALPKLRVKKDWFAPVQRNQSEIDWIQEVGKIVPHAVPRLLGSDSRRHLFVMEYFPSQTHRSWRDELRDGHVDTSVAETLARIILQIHSGTAGRKDIAAKFDNEPIFYALRLEPYLKATGRVHPDLAQRLDALMRTTCASKHALVHGDLSPKNILIGPAGPILLDAECAWYGDPAFDLAFCLNHLLLKCLWTRSAATSFLTCFDTMSNNYLRGVTWESSTGMEARTSALLPALLLARIDGKSPVDYIAEEAEKNRVRRVARELILTPPARLVCIRDRWARELAIA